MELTRMHGASAALAEIVQKSRNARTTLRSIVAPKGRIKLMLTRWVAPASRRLSAPAPKFDRSEDRQRTMASGSRPRRPSSPSTYPLSAGGVSQPRGYPEHSILLWLEQRLSELVACKQRR